MIAPRFVLFAGVCAGWALAMWASAESSSIRAAGRAWFWLWGVQTALSVGSWGWPFTLAAGGDPGPVPGLDTFGRAARLVHPIACDRRQPIDADQRLARAEATHLVTGIVVGLSTIAVAPADPRTAAFLTLWNTVFNVYPVLWLRRSRARVRRVARRATRGVPDPPGRSSAAAGGTRA